MEQTLSTRKEYWDRIEWLNEQRHLNRLDGPALEWSDGTKEWYINGKMHHEDGPAVEWSNGDKWWYLNGQRHREDGPAIDYINGYKEWWINGKEYSEQDYKRELIKLKLERIKNL